jgi:hypothetical protein
MPPERRRWSIADPASSSKSRFAVYRNGKRFVGILLN